MPKISVIVPVYNVEPYIHRCIDSILNQTFTDFELILVDDGSPDDCGKICDEYAKKDHRITVIHKENGGVSSARNAGIERSNGEYLFFMDSDDYIGYDCLDILICIMEDGKYDLVTMGYTNITDVGETRSIYLPEIGTFLLDEASNYYEFLINNILRFKTSWGMFKLFKAYIIKTYNLRICETCDDFAEDLGFLLAYTAHCKTIRSIDYAGYYYLARNDSMMETSKQKIRLNALNEVAYYYWSHIKVISVYKCILKKYPIVHFLLLNNQISKCCYTYNFDELRKEAGLINKKRWYNRMALKSIFFQKTIFDIVGKIKAKWCLNVYYYIVHKSKKLFLLIEIVNDKFKKAEDNYA